MRLALITLLFGTIVIADASSVSKNMNVTPQNVAPLPRLLRVLRTAKTEEDNEERAIGFAMIDNIFESISVQMALKNKETGVDKAFQLLKLDEVGENLFQNPQFTNWEKYVKMVKGKDADNAILSSLHYRYGDDGVSKLLANAEKKPATKELATKLEAKRLNDWIRDYRFYTPDKVFENLKLNKATDNMFDSPQLATFSKFVDMWNPRNSR
ncbi:Avirulence (Avh) protein, partial [Phytophthora megakarya]